MRRALVCLCLVLAGASLPAPAATGAPAVATGTAISVTFIDDLSPRLAGRPTYFPATLLDDQGHPVPGQTLTLWTQPAGSAGFTQAAQGTTDASGRVILWATLENNAVVEWRYDGDAVTYLPSTPVDLGVEISPRVSARAHDRTLRPGQRLIVTGRTFPAKGGCRVRLWNGVPRLLSSGPTPRLLARSVARADGSYRLVRRMHKAARMHVAVTVGSCAGNARGISHAIAIRVR